VIGRNKQTLEQVQGCNLCRDSKGQSSFGGLRAAALPGPGWAPGQVQSETLAQ